MEFATQVRILRIYRWKLEMEEKLLFEVYYKLELYRKL